MHLQHLAHLRFLRRGADRPSRPKRAHRILRGATVAVAAAAVAAAAVTWAATRTPADSPGSPGHPVLSAFPVSLLTVPIAAASGSAPVTGDTFTLTIMLSYDHGNDATSFVWWPCTPDSEAQDGLGLPGSHGCGTGSAIPTSTPYLG